MVLIKRGGLRWRLIIVRVERIEKDVRITWLQRKGNKRLLIIKLASDYEIGHGVFLLT